MISAESVLFGGKERRSMSKLSIIPDPEFLANPTPGEILLEDFLEPLALSHADYDLMAHRRELGGDLELIEPRAA